MRNELDRALDVRNRLRKAIADTKVANERELALWKEWMDILDKCDKAGIDRNEFITRESSD